MTIEKIPDSNPVNNWRPASVVTPGNASDSLWLDFFPSKTITAQLSKNTHFYKQQKNKSAVAVKIILINLQLIKCESPEEPGIY